MVQQKRLYEFSSIFLKVLGLYSKTNSKRVLVFGFLHCLLMFSVIVVTIVMLFTTTNSLSGFVQNVESISAHAQVLLKIALSVTSQQKVIAIYNASKYFWKEDRCSEAVQVELNELYISVMRLQRFFFYSIISGAIIFILAAYFEKALPLGTWDMQEHGASYTPMFITLTITVFTMAIFVVGFDCLFLSFCTEAAMQFKILCYCFKNLDVSYITTNYSEEEYYNSLRACIQQHDFLLRYLEALRNYFSTPLLVEFLTVGPLICIEIYSILEINTTVGVLRHVIDTLGLFMQIAFYCITADFISSQVSEVSNAIYSSVWYSKYFPKLRTPISIVMAKSQRTTTFTAGGLIDINIRALLMIVRTSWSACAIMRAVQREI